MPPRKKTPTEEKPLNLVGKLAKIMGEMTAIAKTGGNPNQRGGLNYTFVEINELLNDIRPRLAEAGIIMFPTDIEDRLVEFHPRNNGGQSTHAFLTVVWEVTDGDEKRRVVSVGEAIDTSDKAFNKAQTAAEKQALQKLFLVSNEEDNDQNSEEVPNNRPPARAAAPPPPPAPPTPQKDRAVEILGTINKDSMTWPELVSSAVPALEGKKSKEFSEEDWNQVADTLAPRVPSGEPTEVTDGELPEGWNEGDQGG